MSNIHENTIFLSVNAAGRLSLWDDGIARVCSMESVEMKVNLTLTPNQLKQIQFAAAGATPPPPSEPEVLVRRRRFSGGDRISFDTRDGRPSARD